MLATTWRYGIFPPCFSIAPYWDLVATAIELARSHAAYVKLLAHGSHLGNQTASVEVSNCARKRLEAHILHMDHTSLKKDQATTPGTQPIFTQPVVTLNPHHNSTYPHVHKPCSSKQQCTFIKWDPVSLYVMLILMGCGSTGMPLSRYDPCNIPTDARCLVPIHVHIGKHRKDTGGERLTRVLSLNHRETPHFRAVGVGLTPAPSRRWDVRTSCGRRL